MTDIALMEGFEAGTLPPGGFGHREHVRLAWLFLRQHGRQEAGQRLLDGLRAFATRAGKPDKFDGPLTLAWLDAIAAAQREAAAETFESLVARHPHLLDRRSVAAPQR